jgi:hypothetical protein
MRTENEVKVQIIVDAGPSICTSNWTQYWEPEMPVSSGLWLQGLPGSNRGHTNEGRRDQCKVKHSD